MDFYYNFARLHMTSEFLQESETGQESRRFFGIGTARAGRNFLIKGTDCLPQIIIKWRVTAGKQHAALGLLPRKCGDNAAFTKVFSSKATSTSTKMQSPGLATKCSTFGRTLRKHRQQWVFLIRHGNDARRAESPQTTPLLYFIHLLYFCSVLSLRLSTYRNLSAGPIEVKLMIYKLQKQTFSIPKYISIFLT